MTTGGSGCVSIKVERRSRADRELGSLETRSGRNSAEVQASKRKLYIEYVVRQFDKARLAGSSLKEQYERVKEKVRKKHKALLAQIFKEIAG